LVPHTPHWSFRGQHRHLSSMMVQALFAARLGHVKDGVDEISQLGFMRPTAGCGMSGSITAHSSLAMSF
jgi:hypothetical protein